MHVYCHGVAPVCLRLPAPDLSSVAHHPLNGIWAVYNVAQDPWAKKTFKDYRRQYYQSLIGWLYQGGGPDWPITAAFVWSVGSFDVAGVHPISTSNEGSYADQTTVQSMTWLSARVKT